MIHGRRVILNLWHHRAKRRLGPGAISVYLAPSAVCIRFDGSYRATSLRDAPIFSAMCTSRQCPNIDKPRTWGLDNSWHFLKECNVFEKISVSLGIFMDVCFLVFAVFLALPCFSMISHVFPCFSVVAPAFLALSALLFCVCLAFPCFHCFFMNVFFLLFLLPSWLFSFTFLSSCLLVAYWFPIVMFVSFCGLCGFHFW